MEFQSPVATDLRVVTVNIMSTWNSVCAPNQHVNGSTGFVYIWRQLVLCTFGVMGNLVLWVGKRFGFRAELQVLPFRHKRSI